MELAAEIKAHKLLINKQTRRLMQKEEPIEQHEKTCEQQLRQDELEWKLASLAYIMEQSKSTGTPSTPLFHHDHPNTSSPVVEEAGAKYPSSTSKWCRNFKMLFMHVVFFGWFESHGVQPCYPPSLDPKNQVSEMIFYIEKVFSALLILPFHVILF